MSRILSFPDTCIVGLFVSLFVYKIYTYKSEQFIKHKCAFQNDLWFRFLSTEQVDRWCICKCLGSENIKWLKCDTPCFGFLLLSALITKF